MVPMAPSHDFGPQPDLKAPPSLVRRLVNGSYKIAGKTYIRRLPGLVVHVKDVKVTATLVPHGGRIAS